MADLFGRGIRYGEAPSDPTARTTFDLMQRVSNDIAEMELAQQRLREMQAEIDEQRDSYTPRRPSNYPFSRLEHHQREAADLEVDDLESDDLEVDDLESDDLEVDDLESDQFEEYDFEEYDQEDEYDQEEDRYEMLELDLRAYKRYEEEAERLLEQTRADLFALKKQLDAMEDNR
jgi:hypothetical protein